METQIQLMHFGLFDEAKKLLNLIKNDPSEYATLCNDDDLKALPFQANDLGFFMVLVPGQMHGKHGNFTFVANENMRPQAHGFLTKHNVQQFREGVLLVSTTCTWDLVADKLKASMSLGYGAIAFSTPERLQILAENPQHVR